MKRDIYKQLLAWKSGDRRKPLLMRGARQTGKTYIIKEFGECEYDKYIYCNFESDPNLAGFFKGSLKPAAILENLSLYLGQPVRKGKDLLVFDEIQACGDALSSLKYFCEEENDIHIAAAGSLLGVKLADSGSFPVGKVTIMDLYPMTFFEFLEAAGYVRYRELLEGQSDPEPFSEPIHQDLVALLRKYYYVGGMPEAVKVFFETNDLAEVRTIHNDIITSYTLDFAKHIQPADIPKVTLIWESIPSQLAKENKKFIFSALKKSARAREYENALQWLLDIGLVYKACSVTSSRLPLKRYANQDIFKIYLLDVGLLGALAGLPTDIVIRGDDLFHEYSGSFTENYAAQQLKAVYGKELYYWKSKGGMAELDFLYESGKQVYPLEVKAGINPKSKSLRSYDNQFSPSVLLRSSLLNLRKDGSICNIPLYALECLHRYIAFNGMSNG